jgi:hypothetical protein
MEAEIDDQEEYILDSINGNVGRKKKMAVLNKFKLSKYELDELMNEEDKVDKDE